MSPKPFVTILISTPRVAAHAFAIRSTAGFRPSSVQITSVVADEPADAVPASVASAAASAAATSAVMRLVDFIPEPPSAPPDDAGMRQDAGPTGPDFARMKRVLPAM